MRLIPAWFIVGITVAVARADTLWLTTSTGSTIETGEATITRIEGDKLFFMSVGNEASREIAQVARISLPDDPGFTAAEEAYAKGDWGAASDGYQTTLRTPTRPWMKDWSARRLSDAAVKAGRFDAAVSAYIALVQTRPELAMKSRPALPPGPSPALDSGAKQLEEALNGSGLGDAQRQALLMFLFDVQESRADAPAAGAVADRLLGEDIHSVEPRIVGRLKLALATKELAQNDPAAAAKTIEQSKDIFVDPPQQTEALFLTAEAKYAQAKSSDSLKEAALAYMRVVAHGKDQPTPRINQALLKTADILETLKDESGAARLRAAAKVQ